MPYTSDFVTDNSGAPERYTVKTPTSRIVVREKDRDVATLATYNVYYPSSGSGYRPYEGGEPYVCAPGYVIEPGKQPFSIETVNVATATFVVVEE